MTRDRFLEKPIYSAMVNKIYLHYHRDVDIAEHHTRAQKDEQAAFIDLLAKSPIILKTKGFLSCRGKLS